MENNSISYNELVATTLKGLEPVLYDELIALGAKNVEQLRRAVSFEGNKEMLYKANFYLRTALRILVPKYRFQAENEQALYREISKINWSNYLDNKKTFAVDTNSFSSIFSHSKHTSLVVKDAIVDQFRRKTNDRPNIDTADPDLRINVHISEDDCLVSFDSSNDSLHRRGYRQKQTKAPLNEVLAAGLIKLAKWDQKKVFFDPMCGSGTIAIEAAMLASNIPAGMYRRSFGFEKWKDFDSELWLDIYESDEPKKLETQIFASDVSQKAFEIAESNLRTASLSQHINLSREDFLQSKNIPPKGTLIMNPPYGERLKKREIDMFYKNIGSRLKHHYIGWDAWILSSNEDAIKMIGLKPSKKFKLYNGQLETTFMKFEIFDGKHKEFVTQKKQDRRSQHN